MEFKIEAVRLAKRGLREASRRVGIPESSFQLDQAQACRKLARQMGVSATPRSAKELEAEVNRLQREAASPDWTMITKKSAVGTCKESR